MEIEFNLSKDVTIDPDALDVEWLNQAAIYAKWAELQATADKIVRKLTEKVKVLRSELFLEAKAKGEEVLGEKVKPTDAACEAYYRTRPEFIELKEELNEAMYEAEMARNASFAMGHKRAGLENMVRLLGAEYFAGPVAPRDLSHESQKQLGHKKVRSRITLEKTERTRSR